MDSLPAPIARADIPPEGHAAPIAEALSALASRHGDGPAPRHDAATAAWTRQLGESWWRWLREREPAIAEELATAMREVGDGDEVPDWWAAIYRDLRERVAPARD